MSEASEAMSDDAVVRLLALVETRRPALRAAPEQLSRQIGAGALTLAERLLRGQRALVAAGLYDVGTVLARLIWETWCVGVHVLLAGDTAAEKVREAFEYRMAVMGRAFPVEQGEAHPWDGLAIDLEAPRAGLNIEQLAREVDELLEGRTDAPIRIRAGRGYDVWYRFHSTWSAHAGYGTFRHYLVDVPEGPYVQAVAEPRSPVRASDGGVAMSALWVSHLAFYVYNEFGMDTDETSRVIVDIVAAGDAAAPERP